jgi:Na+-transporting NADH:ubiquinone oxidoreductase subunit C
MNKNSNTYIIIYTVVMVVLVAVVLSVTALSLQPRQYANILGEKQNAILEAMGAEGDYSQVVKAYAVNAEGNVVESVSAEAALEMLFGLNDAFAAGTYPVFENTQTGDVVVPLMGKGLWNDIWGYIALGNDMNTIKGIVLDHAGETPGLGAEIKTDKFEGSFVGKTIYEGGELVSIEIVKGGAPKDAPHAVDALSGATKTVQGVQAMLKTCLSYYNAFFVAKVAPAAEQESESNTENTESNE